MESFKSISEAFAEIFIKNSNMTTRQLDKAVRDLEKNSVTRVQGTYYFVDEFGILEL
tara:strand:- start:1 stop:171 length:171 start_codon:yes stop_codon:yes gene_type:complete